MPYGYQDPFLEEQQRMAGMQPGVGSVETVSVDMPSLQQAPRRDMSQFIDLAPPDNSLIQMAIAKRANEMVKNEETPKEYDPTGKTPEQVMAETGRQSELDEMRRMEAFTPPAQPQPTQPSQQPSAQEQESVTVSMPSVQNGQSTIVNGEFQMGNQFGAKSAADKYSNGINYGTDIIVAKGTQAAVPEGEWVVKEAFNQATAEGPNNAQGSINRGYGNSVLVENTKTGERLRYSHLSPGGVAVKPGQVVEGGTVVGLTGATGNTAGKTGQHLDLEYYGPDGEISDVMKSPYAGYITGQPGPQQSQPTQQVQQQAPTDPVYGPQAPMSQQPIPLSVAQPEVVTADDQPQLTTGTELPVLPGQQQEQQQLTDQVNFDQPTPESAPEDQKNIIDIAKDTFGKFFGSEEKVEEVLPQPTPEPVEEAWKPAEDDYGKIQELNEKSREPMTQLLQKGSEELKDSPYEPFIFEGHRSNETQAEYYARGRTKPGKIITNAKPGESNHNHGNAVDIYFRDKKTKEVLSPDEALKMGLYDKMGKVGKSLGLVHGGTDWGWDHPHFELSQ